MSYWGWSGGAKVLGKLPVPGRPIYMDYSRARAYCASSGAGGGCLDIFTLVYHFSFLSPSLWETARYRLKYCLKGPLSPKQPTKLCHIAGEQKDKIDCFDVAIHQMQWLFCIFAFGILEYAHVTTNRPAHFIINTLQRKV